MLCLLLNQIETPNKEDNETSQVKSKIKTTTQPIVHETKPTVSITTQRILTSTKPKISPKSSTTTISIAIDTSKVPSLIKTQKVCFNV